MRIAVITPAPRSRKGNGVTAGRWARILSQLGHRVVVRKEHRRGAPDLLIALHAQKSFASIERYRRGHPGGALALALTGTDLYRDIRLQAEARLAMEWADRLIFLQPLGFEELAPELRTKARVIRQSAVPPRSGIEKSRRWLDVCVLAHLRAVKDPFRAAAAARLLPASSRLRVLHAGAALSDGMERRARREMEQNPRYRWLGDRPRWQVRRLLGRSHAMVLSSEMEGGANAVSEALVAGLPVLSSRIPGSIGMLGADHPGYFEVGDTEGLATLLGRCETEAGFLERLAARSRERAPLYHPSRELEAWRALLRELAAG